MRPQPAVVLHLLRTAHEGHYPRLCALTRGALPVTGNIRHQRVCDVLLANMQYGEGSSFERFPLAVELESLTYLAFTRSNRMLTSFRC